MDIIATLKAFATDEAGAVTADWVMLTAAIVSLGVTAASYTGLGVEAAGAAIAADITSQVTNSLQ